jgi:hypothetical protein
VSLIKVPRRQNGGTYCLIALTAQEATAMNQNMRGL